MKYLSYYELAMIVMMKTCDVILDSIGMNQLDIEPIMKGITKKKIIIKARAVRITLYRCSFAM